MDEKLKKRILEREEIARNIRNKYKERWLVSLAGEYGLFFTGIDRVTRTLSFERRAELRQYFSINLLKRIYNNYLDRVLQIKPSFIVSPSTIQSEDLISAKIAQKLCDCVITPKIEQILYDLYFWVFWADTTLVKIAVKEKELERVPVITYDEKEGEPLEIDTPFGKMQLKDLQGRKLYHKKHGDHKVYLSIKDRDLIYVVIPPFSYLVDPQAMGIDALTNPENPNRVKWIMIESYWTEEKLLENNLKPDDFTPIARSEINEFQENLFNLLGTPMPSSRTKMYLYKEYYEIPSKTFKEGLYVKMIGDKIFEINPLPQPFLSLELLPFVDFRDDPKPLSFYNKPKLFQIRDLNKEYIKTMSKLSKLIEKIGEVTLVADLRTGQPKVITTEDEVIEKILDIPFQQQPQIVDVVQIPMAILRYLEILLMNIEYITATYDIRYPLRERTATEITQTALTSESAFSPSKKLFIDRFIQLAKLGLEVIKHHYPDGKKIEIGGYEYGMVETLIFNKQDLMGRYNVNYALGEFYAMSRTGRYFMLRELLTIPHIAQYLKPHTIMNLINLQEGLETIEDQADEQRAMQENLKILYIPDYSPFVEFYDNHLIHIKSHERFLKLNHERIDAVLTQKYKLHILDHISKIKEQMAEIQQVGNEPTENVENIENIENKEIEKETT